MSLPYRYHVIVHLLEFFLGRLKSVWWRVKFVCLEALIGKLDGEGLIIFLQSRKQSISALSICLYPLSQIVQVLVMRTAGISSACAEAASVVTERRSSCVERCLPTWATPRALTSLENISIDD